MLEKERIFYKHQKTWSVKMKQDTYPIALQDGKGESEEKAGIHSERSACLRSSPAKDVV